MTTEPVQDCNSDWPGIGDLVSTKTGEGFCKHSDGSSGDGACAVLIDETGQHRIPLIGGIPRFVGADNYSRNFGFQWKKFSQVQLDRHTGLNLSSDRFYSGTKWNSSELHGKRVLEAGCGAGRFTEVLLKAGAQTYSVDYSSAVDACYENHVGHPALQIIAQADIYHLPFRDEFFDYVFCYGVLQHTPDPERAFQALVKHLKPGGKIAVDCYVKMSRPALFYTAKYLWRPITTRLPPQLLLRILRWYVPAWRRLDSRLRRSHRRWLSKVGFYVACVIPCWNYEGVLSLCKSALDEWAVLDTFDALSARYDYPQTPETVRSWFGKAGLADITVELGGNGTVGRARKEMR